MTNKDIAFAIKSEVKMGDILDKYGFKVGRARRIPCPFHNGKDLNLGFKDDYYHCFVCGKKGDTIQFVQDYFGISFTEALEKICMDFSLPYSLGERLSAKDKETIEQRVKEAETARIEATRLYKQAQDLYFAALGEVVRLQKLIIQYKPQKGDTKLDARYVEGITNIDYATYIMQEREEALRRYE